MAFAKVSQIIGYLTFTRDIPWVVDIPAFRRQSAIPAAPVVNDPLLSRIRLEHEAMLYPYGFPAKIRSNSATTLKAAGRSWGACRRRYDYSPLEIRMALSESDSPGCLEPPTFTAHGHLLSIVADRENFGSVDLDAGFAVGWATEATAANQEYFRRYLLDVMICALLEARHLVTLQAACVAHQGKGILLAGHSRAGKSSLSYACARRGWTFVSDAASAFLRNAHEPKVIGHPQTLLLRERPEYGKPATDASTETMEFIRGADEVPVSSIVLLNRAAHKGGPPVLIPVSEEDAWNELSFSDWAAQMPDFEDRLGALERLLAMPAYEMRYSALDPAIDLLERLIEEQLD
jgi:hypothetical protein